MTQISATLTPRRFKQHNSTHLLLCHNITCWPSVECYRVPLQKVWVCVWVCVWVWVWVWVWVCVCACVRVCVCVNISLWSLAELFRPPVGITLSRMPTECVVELRAEGWCVELEQTTATHNGNGNFLPDETLKPAGCGEYTHTHTHKHKHTHTARAREEVCDVIQFRVRDGFLGNWVIWWIWASACRL